MKKLFLLVFISFTIFGFSQKLKVKNSTILLGGKEIAKMKTEGETYLFQDLNDTTLAKIEFSGREATSSITELWVNVSNPEGTVSNEVSFRPGLSLNPKKMIAGFVQKELKFFDPTGIRTDVISSFFNSKTERKDKKMYDKIAASDKEASEWISQFNINSNKGLITKSNSNKIVAHLKLNNPENTNPKHASLLILDGDSEVIATINPHKTKSVLGVSISKGISKDLIVKRFDGKSSYINIDNQKIQNRDEFYNTVLKQMYLNGYEEIFDIGVRALIFKEIYKKYHKRINLPVENIFDKKGYVIDKNGPKTEGFITFFIENIPAPEESKKTQESHLIALNEKNVGVMMMIRNSKDDKTASYQFYRVRNGVEFCITEENGEKTCYHPGYNEDDEFIFKKN